MAATTAHREFKDRLYGELARIGKALASAHRLEMLELLAQGERTVESLAGETGTSAANASQHLQVLRGAGLVLARKDGLHVHYRLADPTVFEVFRAVREAAEARLGDVERLVRSHFHGREGEEPVGMAELLRRLERGEVVVVDTRPVSEYAAGHIAGALSIPVDGLRARLREVALPPGAEVVAYCRGPFCIYADEAVRALRDQGIEARRLLEGFPEWRAAGHPIETGMPGAAEEDPS